MMDTCHHNLSKLTECTTSRVNPNINYGLWEFMICQCRFTDYNKCNIQVGDVDNGGRYICIEVGGI